MPYILYKTNGSVLTTVDDASLNSSTDLSFVGRNYSGYGQVVNDNFVKLLENFANGTAPATPIQGQLWFNSAKKTLNFSHNGKAFKSIANMFFRPAQPELTELSEGDLWWDSTESRLKVYDGSFFSTIGPLSAATSVAFWSPESVQSDDSDTTPILKAKLDNKPIAVISYRNITPSGSSELYTNGFTTVKPGISLPGADAIGSTELEGYLFWGTAAHSRYSNTSTYAVSAGTAGSATTATMVSISKDETTNQNYFLTFVSTSTGNRSLVTSGNISYNPQTQILNAKATSAFYADIAERYEADAVYEPGTVLMHGGEKEVTIACYAATTAVAGIVSTNPAYMMNSDAGNDETHPYIALKGRVPCKICGSVKKGDLLVASGYKPGYAVKKQDHDSSDAVIGKALEDFEGSFGVIEVKV
jgi:hypothetical protein